MRRVDLVTVGDVMIDVRVEAGALARGGDVHGHVLVRPGGGAANAAVWAAWSGARTRVIGRVGDDVGGRVVREALAERGVQASLTVDPEQPTGTMLVVFEAGERSMVADRGANARLSLDELPVSIHAGAVLVSGYQLLQADSRAAAVAALRRAEAPYVAVDPASWPLVEAFGAERFLEETAPANTILANENEARSLTGAEGDAALRALAKRYAVACVKLGARGALLSFQGDLFEEPGVAVEEIDPTGAGDAFGGVLLGALARGTSPRDALRRACRAGALQASRAVAWPEREDA